MRIIYCCGSVYADKAGQKYVPPVPEEEADEWLERTYDDTDTIVLHRFFERHADKIGKELLSSSKVLAEKMTPEAEAAAANGKRAWDALCAALVELGQPLESPKLSTLTSREHRDYLDLMSRCDRRDTAAVQELFVEGITPQVRNHTESTSSFLTSRLGLQRGICSVGLQDRHRSS